MAEEHPATHSLMLNYLAWSIAYYQHDTMAATDNMYDTGCRLLRERYGSLPVWFQKLASLEDLRAGTGFTVKQENLPYEIACDVCDILIDEYCCDRVWA